MATVNQFAAKTRDEFRDDGLRTLRYGLMRAGITNPNVAPKSDYYVLFDSIAGELEVLSSNLIIKGDAQMPDTAEDEDLDRWLTIVGLARRAAAGSAGGMDLKSSAPSPVTVGATLIDDAGLQYAVQVGGLYAPLATIPIQAIDVGDETNLVAGSTLRWTTAPPFAEDTATVSVGGLKGGAAAEDNETARRRLLRRLSRFPGSGNWTQIAETAEGPTPKIQAAFPYPAIDGPATLHVAVVGYTSATNKSRAIDATTMSGTIVPYVLGKIAEHVEVTTTTSADVLTDVAIFLSLPASPAASVPGPGGGWLDGTPWPRPVAADTPALYCAVTQVTSTTVFRVRSAMAPSVGATRICWLSPIDWQVYSATVVASTLAAANEWDITIDQPFLGIAVGHLISPQSANQQAYFDAIVLAFAQMGPGEKTSNATLLARGYRRPTPSTQWPSSLGAVQLRAVSDSGSGEVLDVQYAYRSTITPAIPASTSLPPNILIPRNLAFYELTT